MQKERQYKSIELLPKLHENYAPTSKLEQIAANIAEESHTGVFRKSGEPYFYHCQAVAAILDTWGITDTETKAAAWVHDVLEDCPWISKEALSEQLGDRVVFIVDGVSKFISTETGKSDKTETHRKVLDRQYVDFGVAFVKLADRVHNMSTLSEMSLEKQKEKAEETLNIYVPLAEAVGLWEVKTYLEDISFQYLYPEKFKQVSDLIQNDPRLDEKFIEKYTSETAELMDRYGIDVQVEARIGGLWNLTKKQELAASRGFTSVNSFSSISDVISVRVLPNSIDDCYRAIGVLHQKFGSNVDYKRYNEYIGANMRVNGYQALQTTLNLPEGALEIAVTTKENELFNNWGVIQRINAGVENPHDSQLKAVIVEIEGRQEETVRFLLKNATGVDLAYTLSDLVGASTDEILIDGVLCPVTTEIPNASRVELVVGATRRAPKPDFVNYALPRTKILIERQENMKMRDEQIHLGIKKLETVLSKRGYLSIEDMDNETQQSLLNNLKMQSIDDLYFYMGIADTSYIPQIEYWCNRKGITKENLGISTLQISGRDQKGILSEITALIVSNNGNITNFNLSSPSKDTFQMRIVVENLGLEGEVLLRKYLTESEKYEKFEVV